MLRKSSHTFLLGLLLILVGYTSTVCAVVVSGSTSGSFDVSPNGAATYTIPIVIPPGIKRIEPHLALSYNSQRGNGLVGVGWSLSGLSSISRCAANLALDGIRAGIDFTAERFCLDGSRLIYQSSDPAGTYREYRTEIDNFSRIRAYGGTAVAPAYFKVWTKGGTVSEYGFTTDSKQILGAGTFTWAIDKLSDQNNNFYSVSYTLSSNTLYPSAISYTGNSPSLAPTRQVSFSYDDPRPDVIKSYVKGVAVDVAKRISKITTTFNGSQVRSYTLNYSPTNQTESTGSKRSRLASIQECGAVASTCFAPTTFTYNSEGTSSFTLNSGSSIGLAPGNDFDLANMLIDFNGDGLMDIVKTGVPSDTSVSVLLAKPDGSYNTAVTTAGVITAPATGNGFDQWNEIVDVNGDGIADIFQVSSTNGAVTIWYGTVAGGFSGSYSLGTGFITFSDARSYRYNNQLTDMNGDGLMDIVSVTGSTGFNIKYGYLNNGNYTLLPCNSGDNTCNFNVLANSNSPDHGFRQTNQFADMNGDGIVDIFEVVFSNPSDPTTGNNGKVVFGKAISDATIPGGRLQYTSSGSGQPVVTPMIVDGRYSGYFNYYNQLVDINGDGIQDIARVAEGATTITNGPTIIIQNVANVKHIVAQCNMNSSPCFTYLIKVNQRSLDHNLRVSLGNGDGTFSAEVQTDLGSSLPVTNGTIDQQIFLDWIDGSSNDAHCTTGSPQQVLRPDGFTFDLIYNNTICDTSGGASNNKGLTHYNQFADMDGDGYVDIVKESSTGSITIAYGKGDGTFNSATSTGLTLNATSGFRAANRLVDMNGDGVADIFAANNPNNASSPNGSTYTSQRKLPSLTSRIADGYGLITNVTYQPLTNAAVYTKTSGTETYPLHKVTVPLYVVDGHSVTDNTSGATFTYNYGYKYKDARVDVKRGWLGFNETSVIDKRATQNIEIRTRYAQNYPYIGRPDYIVTRFYQPADSMATAITSLISAANKPLRSTSLTLNKRTSGNVNFVYEENRVERQYDPDNNFAQIIATATSYTNTGGDSAPYDLYGNPEKVTVTNSVDTHRIDTQYTNNYATSDFPGQLASQTMDVTHTTPAAGASLRRTTRTFDAKGRLITQVTQPQLSNTLSLTTTYGYDSYGQIASQTASGWDSTYDANGNQQNISSTTTRSTTYTYANLATRNWTVTQSATVGSITHNQVTTYDAYWGVPKQISDPNTIVTWFDYDEFGRKITDEQYHGTAQAVPISTTYIACSTACATGAKSIITVTPQGTTPTVKQYDALEREIRTVTTAISGSNIFQDTQYDTAGRRWKVSNPYFSGTPSVTTTTYDDQGRLSTTTLPNGSLINTAYSGLQTTTTRIASGETNQVTTYTRDSQGQVITIHDAAGANTQYTYGPFGTRNTITDAASHNYNATYDAFGNLTSQDDPDLGHQDDRYNAFGEVTWQKDAKGQITSSAYDSLGRMTSRSEGTGASAVTTTWTYDTSKGKGLLDNETRDGVTVSYSYDAVKRPSSTTTSVGTGYTISQAYDSANRVSTVTYPNNGLKVQYNYYNNGLLNSITDANTTSITYWHATGYTATDQVNAETWGNNVTGTRQYNAQTNQLTAITTGSGNSLQNLTYAYFASGNLQKRTNNKSGVNEQFTYDTLDRLKSVTPSNGTATQYSYDNLGNITTRSDIGTLNYAESSSRQTASGALTQAGGIHAITSIDRTPSSFTATQITQTTNFVMGLSQPTTPVDCQLDSNYNVLDVLCMRATIASVQGDQKYTYDANGNMITGGGRTIAYTQFNMPASVTANGNATTFTYGPGYDRLVKNENSGTKTTTYIGKLYEKVQTATGTEQRFYIAATGRLVAMVKTGTTTSTYYIHTDLLGSIDVITNNTGTDAGNISFDEFGDDRAGNWGTGAPTSLSVTTRGYTGHESDTDSGLINMNARLYDPLLGRFTSPDPTIPDVYNPQSLNRYSYVLNNPFRYTDPTGYVPFENGIYDTYDESILAGQLSQSFSSTLDINTWKSGDSSSNFIFSPNPVANIGIGEEAGNPQSSVGMANGTTLTNNSTSYSGGTASTNREYVANWAATGTLSSSFNSAYTEATSTAEWGVIENTWDILKGFTAGIRSLGIGISTLLSGDTPQYDKIVIGEGMQDRVIPYAEGIGAEYYLPSEVPRELWLENNRVWINQKMDESYHIFDIGPQPGRANYPAPTSPFYQMELDEINKRSYMLHYQVNPDINY